MKSPIEGNVEGHVEEGKDAPVNKGDRILVTAALPYANGSIHIGHLLEYIQADVFVRALKLMGKDAAYVCADDTHGTPIQVKAMKLGIKPEELINKYHQEHMRDFSDFHIEFDSYYTTNSPENKELVEFIFKKALEKGFIYKKPLKQLYCEHDKMFLPDRFVKGTCPRCGAKDQYGDVCEKCGAVYKPIDLIDPYCVICGNKPVVKETTHYFFKLSAFSKKLKEWLLNNKELQKEIVNSIMNWIDKGLEDWCISRDSPYFGFKIPGEEDKYFYVWMDAPVGYIASTWNYCREKRSKEGLTWRDYWANPNSKIIHIIGKDIIYFHFLFWPAMLMTAELNLPFKEVVHGFVNINGEKMSKSRGTFITARQFLNSGINPEYLRFYFAANLSKKLADVNLDFNDFKKRINNELIGNIANFSYRVLSFINKNFDSRIGGFNKEEYKELVDSVLNHAKKAIDYYENLEFRSAVKEILIIGDLGNEFFQKNEPWKLIKNGEDGIKKAHEIVSLTANIVKIISILLRPITPGFSMELFKQMNLNENLDFKNINFDLKEHSINKAKIILKKIEDGDLKMLVKEQGKGVGKEVEQKAGQGTKQGTEQETTNKTHKKLSPEILDLRVAEIKEVKDHPNADKLYVLKIDLGTEQRQLLAGLKKYYKMEDLVGKHIIIIANLKPRRIRGLESQGMLLAADDKKQNKIVLLEAPNSKPGSIVFFDGIEPKPKEQVVIDEFLELKLKVKNKRVISELFPNNKMKTEAEDIIVKASDDSIVS